jgi:hypothetical protein
MRAIPPLSLLGGKPQWILLRVREVMSEFSKVTLYVLTQSGAMSIGRSKQIPMLTQYEP